VLFRSNPFSKLFADAFHLRELLNTGLLYLLQPTEMCQQIASALITYPANFRQTGCGACLAALGTVPGNGETVSLVAYLLNQVQRRVVTVQAQGTGSRLP
jgi:hypothetical protein